MNNLHESNVFITTMFILNKIQNSEKYMTSDSSESKQQEQTKIKKKRERSLRKKRRIRKKYKSTHKVN